MIQFTRLAKDGGPLTKRISLSDAGTIISDGSACLMSRGTAHRVVVENLDAFAGVIARLQSHEAIALGALREGLPDAVDVVTKGRLAQLNGTAAPTMIVRTADSISYTPGQPALALIDYDRKGMPDAVAKRVAAAGGFREALTAMVPDLASAASVSRTSTSAGLYRSDTGDRFASSGGAHWFVQVADGADMERFLRVLHERCWLAGLGWLMVGAGGQLLDRSLVDRMVYAPERLVFEGAPILVPRVAQEASERRPEVHHGEALDTRAACPDLTQPEKARVAELRRADAARLRPEAEAARVRFLEEHTAAIASRIGCTETAARRIAELHAGGVLLPAVVLPFDAEELAGCTVGDVLADPARFVGETLADPLEGVAYGCCKAKVMRRADGTAWINSFAHGRSIYDLKHDAASVEAAIRKADARDAADVFVRILLDADLAADDEQRLRDLAGELAGVKARPFAAKIRAARQAQEQKRAAEERERRAAARTDRRIRLPAPLADAERLPVLRSLDEVLGAVAEAEPPMRDLDGHPIEVRCRPPLLLHELTGAGANGDELREGRLPPPDLPLLTRHDSASLAHLIERHIAYTVETKGGDERAVALPPVFIEHFVAYRDSKLPRVGAIVGNPLVLLDGALLAPAGLDRQRKLVFRIDPALRKGCPAMRDAPAKQSARRSASW